jgi:YfiH family protein
MTLPQPNLWLTPDWQPHPAVRACVTTRLGNFSPAPWKGFNLGLNCEDDIERVTVAREHVRQSLKLNQIGWLTQVHGTQVVSVPPSPCEADASISTTPLVACTILTADCLPVLFARRDGSTIAAAHAGWRGLADGVLANTLKYLAPHGENVSAWLGPAICQACYQVDDRVHDSFLAQSPASEAAFTNDGPGHYRLSLAQAARLQLEGAGVEVTASDLCTSCSRHNENGRFYSYRKEAGKTGRFASLVWLD